MTKKFYVTTPIYYVNAAPHIGSAYTTIAADVLARYWRQKLGDENVFFLTGTDEHGAKIQEIAGSKGKSPEEFTTEIADEFKRTWEKLDIKYDNFIRTTDKHHEDAVKWVTQKLYDQGDIYKGKYHALYCVGCEQYKTKSELLEGDTCPDHNRKCEIHEEDAYLFRLSHYEKNLKEKIEKDEIKIRPEARKNEILSFINTGLEDVAVSRKKENVSWGVDLPFDTSQTTYVWVDAFLNYLTGLGWPDNETLTDKFWPADIQLMGKDIIRVHATIWQAMLLALGLEPTKELFVHGFITSGGKKMSKSLGNVISPSEVLERYGADTLRYVLLREFPLGQDGDITKERIFERYTTDLANDLGNLVNRVVSMIKRYEVKIDKNATLREDTARFFPEKDRDKLIGELAFDKYLENTWDGVRFCNRIIDEQKPWDLAKSNREELRKLLQLLYEYLKLINSAIAPIMPSTSGEMEKQLETLEPKPLFPRLEKE